MITESFPHDTLPAINTVLWVLLGPLILKLLYPFLSIPKSFFLAKHALPFYKEPSGMKLLGSVLDSRDDSSWWCQTHIYVYVLRFYICWIWYRFLVAWPKSMVKKGTRLVISESNKGIINVFSSIQTSQLSTINESNFKSVNFLYGSWQKGCFLLHIWNLLKTAEDFSQLSRNSMRHVHAGKCVQSPLSWRAILTLSVQLSGKFYCSTVIGRSTRSFRRCFPHAIYLRHLSTYDAWLNAGQGKFSGGLTAVEDPPWYRWLFPNLQREHLPFRDLRSVRALESIVGHGDGLIIVVVRWLLSTSAYILRGDVLHSLI